MQQYFAGRSEMKVSEIPDDVSLKIENKIFANERIDKNWNKTHLKISNSTFAKMGFRSSKFVQCDLSFCVFIDCYFKSAIFEQTNFLSCVFINCNFDLATVINCDFQYATFDGCFLTYNQMKGNLPHDRENLCADLCRNLSLQCLNLGQIDDYKAYLFEEKAAGETHAIRKLFHKRGKYYDKYTLLEGLEGLFVFLRSKLSKFLWGYGEKMGLLLRNIIITLLVYAIIYFSNSANIVWNSLISNKFLAALYLSACNFFSVSNSCIVNTSFLQCVELSEHIIGIVLIGFFGAALFRQINRR